MTHWKKGMKLSPARAKTAEVLALYAAETGCKTIAKRLGISPRIARQILIEHGVYQPGRLQTTAHRSARRKGRAGTKGWESYLATAVWAEQKQLLKTERAYFQKYRTKYQAKQKRKPRLAPGERQRNYIIRVQIKCLSKRVRSCLNGGGPRTCYNPEIADREHKRRKMVEHLRNRLREIIGGRTRSNNVHQLFGCSPRQLVAHIQSQFIKGMNWNNRAAWHVDHVIPCAAFDLTDPQQQRLCFHYSNLKPIWAKANQAKGAILPRNATLPLLLDFTGPP